MTEACIREPVFKVRAGACSDKGMVRMHNEDSFLVASPYFVVADGMGGHARGEAASRAAVDAFLPAPELRWATSDGVVEAVAAAGMAIGELGGVGRPPGSTLAGVGLSLQSGRPCWLVFNIGDSRTYLLRDGYLTQISVDHVARHDRPGGWSRNVITRALGAGLAKPSVADQWLLPARPGDQILVCSDGLHTEVTDLLVAAILLGDGDPHDKAVALVNAAKSAGGRDNVTAVVLVADEVLGTDGLTGDTDETLRGTDDTVPDEELE